MTQTFTITPPPSANKLWRYTGGRPLKSREYRQWMKVAQMEILLQRNAGTPALSGPVEVLISMKRMRKNADLDNRIKPTLDALESGGAIVNDKQIVKLSAEWATHDGCRVTVRAA